MDYLLHILILIQIYAILAISMNILAGHTGLLSLSHAAFFGVGAYVSALMVLKFGVAMWVGVLWAVAVSGIVGVLVGTPSLRVRQEHFVVATLALQVVCFSVLNNWQSLTRGPLGLSGIPQPSFMGTEASLQLWFLMLAISLCIVVFIYRRIVDSPLGRVLRAIREDEIQTTSLGKGVATCKIIVFAICASIAGLAGALYAHYISFIDPTSFTVMESIFILSIVIIGGAGSLWGPVVGAVVLVTLPELLRFLGLPSSVAANLRQIIYGGALVAFMMWRPRGLLGEYAFQSGEARA